MPSRRAVLAALAATPLAGCSLGDDAEATAEPPLSGRAVHLVGDLSLPRGTGARTVPTEADADAVVIPPGESYDDTALYTLGLGIPVVIAGRDAPKHARRVCEMTGERYGVPSDGWTPDDRFAAILPAGDRLVVEYLRPAPETDLVPQLPWALAAVLDGRPPAFSISRPPRPDGGVELGWARLRGRTDVGGYDRWDRVTLLPKRSRAVVETLARATAADTSFPDGYLIDRVAVSTAFSDASVEATGPASASAESFSVEQTVSGARSEVTHAFAPATPAGRQSLTVGARTVVSLSDPDPPFGYVGNVRFRWRDPRLLQRDRTWVAHTPGRAVWDGF